MKNLIFIFCILIILFKTETVLSNNNIFDVNNIEISEENSKNKEELLNQAFKKAFNKLIKRLLLEEDYRIIANTNLEKIKKLISYYQIINSDNDLEDNYTKLNVFFDKDREEGNLHPVLDEVVDNWNALDDDEQREEFRLKVASYTRLYSYLSQIVNFSDIELEKHYIFTPRAFG